MSVKNVVKRANAIMDGLAKDRRERKKVGEEVEKAVEKDQVSKKLCKERQEIEDSKDDVAERLSAILRDPKKKRDLDEEQLLRNMRNEYDEKMKDLDRKIHARSEVIRKRIWNKHGMEIDPDWD